MSEQAGWWYVPYKRRLHYGTRYPQAYHSRMLCEQWLLTTDIRLVPNPRERDKCQQCTKALARRQAEEAKA